MTGKTYIGTSGWSYEHWKYKFYKEIPQKNWLHYCSENFTSIEINATFYRLQSPVTFKHWYDSTTENFRFSIKANRYLTHSKRLKNPEQSITLEKKHAQNLGNKLAAVVWQLPGQFHKNMERLNHFATALKQWPGPRHVIEFRDASWFDEEVATCLHSHRVAACISDAADWPRWDKLTTNFVYLRLHGHAQTYISSYNSQELGYWYRKIRAWLDNNLDVFVYFDNDAECAAPYDAMKLIAMLHKNSIKENSPETPSVST